MIIPLRSSITPPPPPKRRGRPPKTKHGEEDHWIRLIIEPEKVGKFTSAILGNFNAALTAPIEKPPATKDSSESQITRQLESVGRCTAYYRSLMSQLRFQSRETPSAAEINAS